MNSEHGLINSGELDAFDNLEQLRLSQDYSEELIAKKSVVSIAVTKPHKQQFVRVNPDWSIYALIINFKETGESYLVHPSLECELFGEANRTQLKGAMTRDGEVFLWPIPYPSDNTWHSSSYAAAQIAEKKWIRVISSKAENRYQIFESTDILPEPVWPDLEFKEVLRIAFKDQVISSLDHPIVKALRGIK